jgi:CBS domain-containing protein
MRKMEPNRTKSKPLEVRVRRALSGSGEQSSRMTVFCPRREHSLTVEECVHCEHCEGIALDPDDRGSVLMCRAATDETARSFSWRNTEGKSVWSLPDETPVTDVMTGNVVCVEGSVSVESLTGLLLENGISGVPVVDDAGRPIGIVTKTDLLREGFERGETEEHEPLHITTDGGYECELGPGFHADRIARATVGEIMTPVTFTLREDATVSQASALMAFEAVHRVPVVDRDGKVVGILSSLDVLRWLARECGYVVPPTNRYQRD